MDEATDALALFAQQVSAEQAAGDHLNKKGFAKENYIGLDSKNSPINHEDVAPYYALLLPPCLTDPNKKPTSLERWAIQENRIMSINLS